LGIESAGQNIEDCIYEANVWGGALSSKF
jgi:hypothetical protein